MSASRILQLGDPLLRRMSEPVARPGDASQTLVNLRDTLHAFQRAHGFGRGISAIQIGVPQRVIYLEFAGVAHAMVNPVWESRSEEAFCLWDDCFSFPGLLVWLERSRQVRLRYQDQDGVERQLAGSDALAELLQHEMDHLDGVLAVDRALGPNALRTRDEHVRQLAAGRQAAVPGFGQKGAVGATR